MTSPELATSPPQSPAARPGATSWPSPLLPQPFSSAPPPDPPSRSESDSAAGELVVVTASKSGEVAVTPSVALAAAEVLPITGADGLSGDQEPVMPLIISDASTGEAVREEAEDTLNMTSSGRPLATPVSVGDPAVTEPSLNLSQTPDTLPEGASLAEEDTTTLSAPTLLSGDGEDRDPPSYAHLRETDSDPDLDYQYDPADAFLPVSSDALYSLCLHDVLLLLLPFHFSQHLTGIGNGTSHSAFQSLLTRGHQKNPSCSLDVRICSKRLAEALMLDITPFL